MISLEIVPSALRKCLADIEILDHLAVVELGDLLVHRLRAARVGSRLLASREDAQEQDLGLGQLLAQLLDDRLDALGDLVGACSSRRCWCRSSARRPWAGCRRARRSRSARAHAGCGRRRCRSWPRCGARRTASRRLVVPFQPWVIESPRNSRSMFPCLARSRNDSCSFIQPSRALGTAVVGGLRLADRRGSAQAGQSQDQDSFRGQAANSVVLRESRPHGANLLSVESLE